MMVHSRRFGELAGALMVATAVVTLQWLREAPVGNPPLDRAATAKPAAKSNDRGPQSPSEISGWGWLRIARRTFEKFSENDLLSAAASVTFYGLLAIFPAIAAIVSLYGLLADPKTIAQHLNDLGGVVPGGGMQIISGQIDRLVGNSSSNLGTGVILGILMAIWSANQGTKALFAALNAVYERREQRSFFKLTAQSLAFTAGAIIFIILALLAVIVLPIAFNFIGLPNEAEQLVGFVRWPLVLLTIGFFLACLYYFGPSREDVEWKWISWGSAFASVAWVAFSAGFSWYVQNFGSYNKTYGSLGAAIGFMTWIWLSAAVMLAGAQLNAEIEREANCEGKAEPNTRAPARAEPFSA